MDRTVPPHWLRRNEGSRSPHRVLYLDTETRQDATTAAEYHTLRWWHARHIRRHVDHPRTPVQTDVAGDSAAELAQLVDQLAIAKHSMWLYTHNLGFDLQISRLPELLYERGWQIVDIGITGRSPWIRMCHGRRRLIMADSSSWLPAPLKDVGEAIGIPKLDIDDWSNATDEQIAARCYSDVVILSQAMLSIMDWWDDNDMGRWQWTGPGCGWAAFRHGFLDAKVLMDPEPERMTLERKAIYGGRREAYRIGRLGAGHYVDLDFQAAYPSIASYLPLPRRPVARVPYMTAEAYKALPEDWGILSECTVTTDKPVVPCRVGGHTLYPVGTFKTVLAGPDINGAIECGAVVDLGDTIVYQLEPYLSRWGKWITAMTSGEGPQVPPAVRMWGKHIGRTVIGRFAMHSQRTEDWGDACWPSFHADAGTDWDTGCEVVDLHAAGRHLRVYRDQEPENVFPAVTAYVEAECRQLLRKGMEACPPGSVLQSDTDGWMLALPVEGWAVAAPAPSDAPNGEAATAGAPRPPGIPERIGSLSVRVKGLYKNAVILGPQQVILGDSRRISGVPKAFTSEDNLTYQGWAWPGYTWQLARSEPGVYTRPHVTIALRGPYGSRWLTNSGWTMTPAVHIRNGENCVLRPDKHGLEFGGEIMQTVQPAILEKLAS